RSPSLQIGAAGILPRDQLGAIEKQLSAKPNRLDEPASGPESVKMRTAYTQQGRGREVRDQKRLVSRHVAPHSRLGWDGAPATVRAVRAPPLPPSGSESHRLGGGRTAGAAAAPAGQRGREAKRAGGRPVRDRVRSRPRFAPFCVRRTSPEAQTDQR